MGTDQTEALVRGRRIKESRHSKHPFAAIDHRVIDSPAFADLKPAACRLLVLLVRQLNGKNNGHLQATFSWCKERGIGSEHTLQSAIADLIAHGFLYRTRSHGANKAWARYALTWIRVTNTDDLFMDGFVAYAWRDWTPCKKKTTPNKLQEQSCRNCSFTQELPAETAGTTPAKTAEYEESTSYDASNDLRKPVEHAEMRGRFRSKSPHAIRFISNLDRPPLRLVA